ncbi:peptide deformylase [Candidatus Peregrinibacteria bacterium]|nr:peptide deformylase [Candidatus Peregrinibacteria bacterium]
MAKLKILTGANNLILRKKSEAVKAAEISGKKLSKLIKDMRDTLGANDLGLAAAQVGSSVRVCLVRLNSGTNQARVIVMINPEIAPAGRETEIAEEGCLSLPEVWVRVERKKNITVKFLDVKGAEQVLTLENLNARVIQHEIDHLDGILIVDKGTAAVGKKTIL